MRVRSSSSAPEVRIKAPAGTRGDKSHTASGVWGLLCHGLELWGLELSHRREGAGGDSQICAGGNRDGTQGKSLVLE